jgi:hypothetical protein
VIDVEMVKTVYSAWACILADFHDNVNHGRLDFCFIQPVYLSFMSW